MNPRRAAKNTNLIAWVILSVLVFSGCQALHPFAEKSKARFATAKNWANRGLEAFQCGRLNQAKGLLIKATNEDPTDFRMRANLARTLNQSGDQTQAIGQMQQAVDQSQGDPALRIELGEMHLNSGQWAAARRQAELALGANHQYGPAWFLLGKTQNSQGDHGPALASFHRAVSSGMDTPEVQMAIYQIYRDLGQPHRALASIEQLLSHYSNDDMPEDAMLAKSDVLLTLKQYQPAIEVLQVATGKVDASGESYLHLARALDLSGKASQARLALKEGKHRFPDEPRFDDLIRQASLESVDPSRQANVVR